LALGKQYANGVGVTVNLVQAYKWLRLAGSKGMPEALDALEAVKAAMTPAQIDEGNGLVQARLDLEAMADQPA
jgi:TPR repeat protein